MRICIDLDGVICKLRGKEETYNNLKPIKGSVEKITELKRSGHYIIIYTARRMKTHKANLGKINADIGKVTLDWLQKHSIPFDEIYFGKPWADVYIDDNAFKFISWSEIDGQGKKLPMSHEKRIRGDE